MLIGISGCSGSGKNYFASLFATKLNAYPIEEV
jgi:uridine kinase